MSKTPKGYTEKETLELGLHGALCFLKTNKNALDSNIYSALSEQKYIPTITHPMLIRIINLGIERNLIYKKDTFIPSHNHTWTFYFLTEDGESIVKDFPTFGRYQLRYNLRFLRKRVFQSGWLAVLISIIALIHPEGFFNSSPTDTKDTVLTSKIHEVDSLIAKLKIITTDTIHGKGTINK